MKVRIFYAGQLFKELPEKGTNTIREFRTSCSSEIYNGAYAYVMENPPEWFRMDGTPVLLSDVPKELQLLNLIL